jgi:hypothetical protein
MVMGASSKAFMNLFHKHHIIPRHAGGSNELSNIELVTVAEHAERHRILWEQHGRIQDKIAWMALSKKIGKEEANILAIKAANTGRKPIFTFEHRKKLSEKAKGREYSKETRDKWSTQRSGKEYCSKKWIVTSPTGEVLVIQNLRKFCREHNLNQGAMCRASIGNGHHTHKGWRCKKP